MGGADVGEKDADHVAVLGDQPPGGFVGNIVVLGQELQDAGPGLGVHVGLVVHHP